MFGYVVTCYSEVTTGSDKDILCTYILSLYPLPIPSFQHFVSFSINIFYILSICVSFLCLCLPLSFPLSPSFLPCYPLPSQLFSVPFILLSTSSPSPPSLWLSSRGQDQVCFFSTDISDSGGGDLPLPHPGQEIQLLLLRQRHITQS